MDKQLQYMIDNGFEVHVILPNDSEIYNMVIEREKNVIFHEVPIKRNISIISDFINLIRIIILLLKIKPDILHLHTPKASLLGVVAGRLTFQKNIIYQMHGLVSGGSTKKGLMYFIEKITCSLSTKVFAVSNSLKDFAIENGYVTRNKISVIGNGSINGIDYNGRFNPLKANKEKYRGLLKSITPSDFVVGFVGRINHDKGILDFIEVINQLNETISVKAIVLGPNEMGSELDEIIKKNSKLRDTLIFIDGVEDPENIMIHFDVLLLPTKREGFGLVAAECNSLEIPVVSYNIPGIKDAVENHATGELVDRGDVNGLANSVIEYYNNPEKLKLHGNNGRKRVKVLFNQEYIWKEFLNEYRRLLDEKNIKNNIN